MTSIWISQRNKERLQALGKFKDTHEKIISRVLDIFEFKRADELTGVNNAGDNYVERS